jgi:hypothetical protein
MPKYRKSLAKHNAETATYLHGYYTRTSRRQEEKDRYEGLLNPNIQGCITFCS